MFEVTDARHNHSHTVSIAVIHAFLVTNRPAWLDDGIYACFMSNLYTVAKREESVASHHGTRQVMAK